MKILLKVQGEKDEVFGLVFFIKISALAKIPLSGKGQKYLPSPGDQCCVTMTTSSAHQSCKRPQMSSSSLVQDSLGLLRPAY